MVQFYQRQAPMSDALELAAIAVLIREVQQEPQRSDEEEIRAFRRLQHYGRQTEAAWHQDGGGRESSGRRVQGGAKTRGLRSAPVSIAISTSLPISQAALRILGQA